MKVLVTGVGGFLGSHIAEHLIKLNHDVYGIDNFIGGEYNNCSYLPLEKFYPEKFKTFKVRMDKIQKIPDYLDLERKYVISETHYNSAKITGNFYKEHLAAISQRNQEPPNVT